MMAGAPAALRKRAAVALLASAALVTAVEGERPTALADGLEELDGLIAECAGAIESAALDDGVKQALQAKLEEARQLRRNAADDQALERSYRKTLATSRDELQSLNSRIESLRDAGPGGERDAASPDTLSLEELERALAEARAEATALREEAAALQARLEAENARPQRIPEEVGSARRSLEQAQRILADGRSADSLGARVERALVTARALASEARIDALEMENASHASRLALLKAQATLQDLRSSRVERRVKALADESRERMSRQAAQAVEAASRMQRDIDGDFSELMEMAAENAALSEELTRVANELDMVAGRAGQLDGRRRNAEQTYMALSAQQTEGAIDSGIAELLLRERMQLPAAATLQRQIDEQNTLMAKARLRAFALSEELETLGEAAAKLERSLRWPQPPAAGDSAAAARVGELLDSQASLKRKLLEAYERLVRERANLSLQLNDYLGVVRSYSDFLNQKLFWLRTGSWSAMLEPGALRDAAGWLTGASRMPPLGEAALAAFTRAPLLSILLGAAVLALVLGRGRMTARLVASGENIGRVASDRYASTLEAALITALLALPLPLVLLLAGSGLHDGSGEYPWLDTLALTLRALAFELFAFFFLYELAREDGLAARHFRWNAASLRRLRATLCWLLPVIALVGYVAGMTSLTSEARAYQSSLGRLVMATGMGLVAFAGYRLFHPRHGILADAMRQNPGGWLNRLRLVWFPALAGLPLLLALLALGSYLFAAYDLRARLLTSGSLLIGAVFLSGMIDRWVSQRERGIAWRNSRRNAQPPAAQPQEQPQASSQTPAPQSDERQFDAEALKRQNSALFDFLIAAALACGLWQVWGSAIPLLDNFDRLSLFGGFSLADLLAVILIIIVTTVAVRNIKGVLEVAFLRNLPLDNGARYAIVTLSQYVLIGVAIAIGSQTLAIDMTSLAWIFAALSVGLGFGLQEVVANFVCGLIILFERPIRVGDIVTVGEVDGIVSRIQIRATTIPDWNRKEFIVPNKEFITGTLLNWTLTNSINRVVIVVGVAYGSDTVRASQLLLEIARQHPDIMDDPEPFVVFDAFDDSSLRLILRAYLPGMERRVSVISELNTSIHQTFNREGIEIPFPQRDLHIRKGGAG